MNPVHETLEWLVNTPSVTGNEGRIATAIAQRLLPHWSMQSVARIGNSLVVGEPSGRPLVALYGHTDTVPEQNNGTARVADGRMHGLGTSDMKAGLAVMIHLLEDEAVRSGAFDVVGVFYDKEEGPADENGLEEVLDRVEWLTGAQLSIVMEPTDLNIEMGCNGALNADVVFTGKSAHSARPWLGENAVTKAGQWLAKLHAMEPELVTIEGLEYREVFSVTRAGGGIANNVIPPEFVINLNHRFPPIFSLDEAEVRLRAVAAEADDVVIRDRAPAGAVPKDNDLVTRLEGIAGGIRKAKQGWTDVARLTAREIPAVNYGPGEVAQAHQVTESVPLENLDRALEVLSEFLTR
ncbi:MAG: succinyl-diaminopimelate desuccinylase [Acidimicrobiia bacterium]|nr:succinyl-diaminopimelate desuccinylase [Acidimicrobiia bacterium]